ncbi:hypothetical protein LTS18_000452, partial [Coniosporium uncinatum]
MSPSSTSSSSSSSAEVTESPSVRAQSRKRKASAAVFEDSLIRRKFMTTVGFPRVPQQEICITHEALSPKKPSIKHRWTVQEMVVLCVLRRWYLNRWDDFAAIMNEHFQHDRTKYNSVAFNSRIVSAYWHTMRVKNTAGAWATVYTEISFHNPLPLCVRLQRRLEAHAERLGIAIVYRLEEEVGLPHYPVSPSSRASIQSSAGFDTTPSPLAAIKQEERMSVPILSRQVLPAPIITPPQSPTGRPTSASTTRETNIPRLLFRRWDENSAGV